MAGRGVKDGVRAAVTAYDAHGALVEATIGEVRMTLERDVLGRVVREAHAGGEHPRSIESRYDLAGERIERETSLGHRAHYDYDRAGDLSAMHADLSPRRIP